MAGQCYDTEGLERERERRKYKREKGGGRDAIEQEGLERERERRKYKREKGGETGVI